MKTFLGITIDIGLNNRFRGRCQRTKESLSSFVSRAIEKLLSEENEEAGEPHAAEEQNNQSI